MSREVVVAAGARLAIVGGLDGNGVTISKVTVVDPANGVFGAARSLARASHDAGAAVVDGRAMVFGGGSATTRDWVQRRAGTGRWVVVGRLPAPRSDLAAVAVGGSAYLFGGYDGARMDSAVLRVSRGAGVEVVGRLPVPVRYPAVAAVGRAVWIVGGRARSGPTDVIQRFDVATGQASVVGRLSRPVEGASAVVLGGQLYICGGVVGGSPTARIVRVDPSTGHVRAAGRLPVRDSYAGAAGLGGAGFIVGGETPATSTDVIRLRLVSASASARHGRQ